MRRKRLPTRRGGGALPGPTALAVRAEPSTDLRYLEQVVAIQFPIRSARQFLQRNMGNRITYRLVESRRGEQVGMVREVEIKHANGGEKSFVRGIRLLANGEPASFFVPDHLVVVKPRISGAAAQTRSLSVEDEIVLHVPVRGYLRFLPQIFQGEGPVQSRELVRARQTDLQRWRGQDMEEMESREVLVDEDPMRRFMFLFQHMMTTVTERIDRLVDLTDPLLCEPKFLPWLASWVGFQLDESLPVHQQRELVRRAIRLMRTRGTRAGIEEMVRVLTSAPVRVEERARPQPVVLGRAVLIGGRDVVERYQRAEPLGSFLYVPDPDPKAVTKAGGRANIRAADVVLDREGEVDVVADRRERADIHFFMMRLEPRERFATRFGERAAQVLRRIVNVVSQERPTHVAFVIRFEDATRPAASGGEDRPVRRTASRAAAQE